jgi:hypothetical protein
MDKVDKLKYGYCDTYWEGLKDPMMHWFFMIWPSATKHPLKDLLHSMKGITSETLGPSSDLHTVFTAALSNGCLEFDEAGKTAAAKKYIKDKKAILTIKMMKEKAMGLQSYKKTIANFRTVWRGACGGNQHSLQQYQETRQPKSPTS